MKKKLSIVTVMMSLVVLFVGCAANPRDQFAKYIEEQQGNKFNASSFEMKIADLEMDLSGEEEANPMMGMVMSQLKNITLKGDVQMDAKEKEDFSMKMSLDLMGMEVPFEMMGSLKDDVKMYVSTNTISSVVEIASTFGTPGLPSVESFASIKDKYIDITDLQEEAIDFDTKAYKKELKNTEEYSKAYAKEAMTYLKSLDKKSFVKKDDTITHTFNKKEIIDLMNLSQKVAKSNDKFKDYVAEEELDAQEVFKELEEFSVKTAINVKDNSYKLMFTLAPAAGEADGFKSIKVSFNGKNTKNDKKVTLPKKAEVVTMPELEKLVLSMNPEGQVDLLEEELFSEEDFAEFKEEIKAGLGALSKEDKEMLLETYKGILSEKQYKELADLMK